MSAAARTGAVVVDPLAPAPYVPRLSRMALLGRRDAGRWGGSTEVAPPPPVKPRPGADAPLEGGNLPAGGLLHAQLASLDRAWRLLSTGEAVQALEARSLLVETHTFLLGHSGLPKPRPTKPREGDPPPPPPKPHTLAIDKALMGAGAAVAEGQAPPQPSGGGARELAPELVVFTSELAAQLEDWPTVWSCLSLFAASAPGLSQYRVRALLVQARGEAAQALGKKGAPFVDHLVAACDLVIQAARLVTDNASTTLPGYNFLLYNASATFLSVARPLLRTGLRTRALPGLQTLAEALETFVPLESPERDPRVEVELLRQAALAASEQPDAHTAEASSQRLISKAWSLLIKRYTLAPLPTKTALVKTFVHLHRSNAKTLDQLVTDMDALSRAQRASFLPGFRQLVALQKVRSGLYAGDTEAETQALSTIVDQLADAQAEASYEGDEDGVETNGRAKKKPSSASSKQEERKSPSASPLPTSASKKKRPKSREPTELSGGPSARELALVEVARLAELEAARLRERARKKARAEAHAHRMEVVAEVAWEALQRRQYTLAQRAANMAILTKRSGLYPAWLLAEMVSVLLDTRREEAKFFNADGNHSTRDANGGLNGYAELVRGGSTSTSADVVPTNNGQGFTARIRGLKVLEQTLSSSSRLLASHPDLVEALIRSTWGLMVPLLQRDLCGLQGTAVVAKLLKTCSVMLGEPGLRAMDQHMVELRVLLHYELALVEASHDHVSKAAVEMEKALALDFTLPDSKLGAAAEEIRAALSAAVAASRSTDSSDSTVAQYSQSPPERASASLALHGQAELPFVHLLRPGELERFQPFLRTLRVQSLLYEEPDWFLDSREDQATRWLEQAKEIRLPQIGKDAAARAANAHWARGSMGRSASHVKKNLVMKAIQLLDGPIFDALNSAAGVQVHTPSCKLTHTSVAELASWTREVRQKRATAWLDVLRQAWEQGFDQLVHVAVAHLLELTNSASSAPQPDGRPAFDQQRHAPIFLAQIEALHTQIRACVAQIRARGYEPGLIRPPTTLDDEQEPEQPLTTKRTAASSEEQPPGTASSKKRRKDKSLGGATAGAGNEKDDDKPASAQPAPPTEEAADATLVEVDSLDARRLREALFYEQLLHASVLHSLHISSTQLTGERFAFVAWNAAVLFHNAFVHLWYRVLEPSSSPSSSPSAEPRLSYLYTHTPAEAAKGATDTRAVLIKVWEALCVLSRAPASGLGASSPLRKPALLLQLATLLARSAERSAPQDAATIVSTAMALTTPATLPYVHPLHPIFDAALRRPLLEIWARLLTRPGSSSSGSGSFDSIVAQQAPEGQVAMLLESLRSGSLSHDEARSRLHTAVSLMTDWSASARLKVRIPLAQVNGDEDPQASATLTTAGSKGGRKTTRREKEATVASPSGGSNSAKKKRGASTANADLVEPLDPLDPSRRLNAAAYALHLAGLRETDALLWCALSVASASLGASQRLLALQCCAHGLAGCPGYTGPPPSSDPIATEGKHARKKSTPGAGAKRRGASTERAQATAAQQDEAGSAGSTPSGSPRLDSAASDNGRVMSPLALERVIPAGETFTAVSPGRLRSFAHLCLVHGTAVAEVLDPSRHDQAAQDAIRSQAAASFTRASGYAAEALARHLAHVDQVQPHATLQANLPTFEVPPTGGLMLAASKAFWNTCLPLTYEPLTRSALLGPLGQILGHLEMVVKALGPTGPTKLDPPFRCELYLLYFSTLGDAALWNEAYASSTAALASLPSQQRSAIWSARVLAMSKLGLDVGVGVLKMKDASTKGRAQVWLDLARAVDPKKDLSSKYDFYVKCLAVLEDETASAPKKESAPTETETLDPVEVLLEFAEFLCSHGFERGDCVEQLLLAVDSLAAREAHVMRAEAAVRSSWPASATHSRMDSAGGGSRMARARQNSISAAPTPTVSRPPRGSTGPSGAASPSGVMSGAQTPSVYGSGGHTRTGSVAGSGRRALLGPGAEEAQAQAQAQESKELTLKHLLLLVRCYGMLGRLALTSRDRVRAALVAHHYAVRAWTEGPMLAIERGFFGRPPPQAPAAPASNTTSATHTAFTSANASKRDSGVFTPSLSLALGGAAGGASTVGAGHRSSLSGGIKIPPYVPVQPAAAAASTIYFGVPRSSAEWLSFALPTSVRSWLREQASASGPWATYTLHRAHLPAPAAVALLHYLTVETLPALLEAGLHLHALPLLHLMELIVAPDGGGGGVLRSRPAHSLVHLHLAGVMDALHLPVAQARHLAFAEPLVPTPEEDAAFTTIVEKREQLLRTQAAEAAAGDDSSRFGAFGSQQGINSLQLGQVGFDDGPRPDTAGTTTTMRSMATSVGAVSNMYGADVLQTSASILSELERYTPAALEVVGPDLNVRKTWLETVDLLLTRGCTATAKALLHGPVLRACRAWGREDPRSLAKAHHCLARLALLEGAWVQSLSLSKHAAALYFGQPQDWLQGVFHLVKLLQTQAYRSSTPTHEKQALEARVRSMLTHTSNTFTKLLYTAEHRASMPALKRALAEVHVLFAHVVSLQERRGFRGFGLEASHAPSNLPVSFEAATDPEALGVATARPQSSMSMISITSGQGAGPSRSALATEQQKLYEEVWAAYERAETIYADDAAADATQPVEEENPLRSLADPSALSEVLLGHAASLVRYASCFAFPAAAALASMSGSAAAAFHEAMLAKATAGTTALHKALLLLAQAESCTSAILLLATPGSAADGSLPVQRRLNKIKTLMASAYLLLYRFKRPRRRFDAQVQPTTGAPAHETQVLRLDGPRLLFASDSSSSLDRETSEEVLHATQERMNALFFAKYAGTFRDAAADAQALLDAPREVAFNERALHLAASALNLEGSFDAILTTLSKESAVTAAAPSATQNASFHPRLLLDSPAAWLALGKALAALHHEAEDQAESDRAAAEQAEVQAKEQAAWAERLTAQAAMARTQGDPRAAEQERLAKERQAEADAIAQLEAEAEQARLDEIARAQLFAAEAERAAEEARLEAEQAKGRKKKRGSNPGSAASTSRKKDAYADASSGEKHYQPESAAAAASPQASGRGLKRDKAAAAAAALLPVAEPIEPRPSFDVSVYERDCSSWSPTFLNAHLEAHALEKIRSDAAALEAQDDKKKVPKKPGSASGAGGSPRAKKKLAEPAVAAPSPTPPEPVSTLPALPSLSSREGQAILALQRTVALCVRRDFDVDTSLSTMAAACLELTDLFGTRHPLHAARYLTLHAGAKLKALALDAWEVCSPSTGSEALVLSRSRALQEGVHIPGPELEMTRKFLKGYSEIWRMLSTATKGFFDQLSAAGTLDGAENEAPVKDGSAASFAPSSTEEDSFSSNGLASFNSMVSSLPPSVVTLTLELDAASSTLYGLVLSSGGAPVQIARASLGQEGAKELTLLLAQYAALLHKIQRSVLVYGCLATPCAPLDGLERAYNTFLKRMATFFETHLFTALLAWRGLFTAKELVLLISSPSLWQLPWEALPLFSTAASVSRDFSLGVFCARLAAQTKAKLPGAINAHGFTCIIDAANEDASTLEQPAVVGAAAAQMVAQAKTAQVQAAAAVLAAQQAALARPPSASSTTPEKAVPEKAAPAASAAARKKGSKAAAAPSAGGVDSPLDHEPLLQGDLVRVLAEMRGVALGSVIGSQAGGAAAAAKDKEKDKTALSALASVRSASAAGWTSLCGLSHTPCTGEWASLLVESGRTCGAFLYGGYEPLLSRVPPSTFVTLPSLSGTQALLLFDRACNGRSYRAASKASNSRSALERSVEGSFFTALFASLKNVPTLLMRAHASAGPTNAAATKLVLEALMYEGASLGRAARTHHTLLATEKVDMVKYLDHAVWAADPSSTGGSHAGSPKKASSAAAAAASLRASSQTRSRAVKPMGPTAVRVRDAAVAAAAAAASAAVAAANSRPMSPAVEGGGRTLKKGAGQGSQARLAAARSPSRSPSRARSPAPGSSLGVARPPALAFRAYDAHNLICVGLPGLKLQ